MTAKAIQESVEKSTALSKIPKNYVAPVVLVDKWTRLSVYLNRNHAWMAYTACPIDHSSKNVRFLMIKSAIYAPNSYFKM